MTFRQAHASEFPRTWDKPTPKPDRAERQGRRKKKTRALSSIEAKHKATSKLRDGGRCRFPRCPCAKLGYATHSSHDVHKKMGGDSTGEKSKPEGLITLCVVRHMTGAISRHAGTLRTRYLTPAGNNGPVAWEVLRESLPEAVRRDWFFSLSGCGYIELARETDVQVLAPLEPWQEAALEALGKEMSR